MKKAKRTPAGEALTPVVLDIFRLASRMAASGDRLVAGLGLTSARWQILGAIAHADRPESVAWLAGDLGGARQNVQRIVNDLEREGFVELRQNPRHRRAQLVVLTDKGRLAFDEAMRLQAGWADNLAQGLRVDDIETTQGVVSLLRKRLDADREADDT